MSTHRTIKFRFWSGSKMFHDTETVMACLKQQLYFDEGNKTAFAYDHIGLFKPAFMAFTGLTDCKGIEIYESDLVLDKAGRRWKIEYSEKDMSFICRYLKNESDYVLYSNFSVIYHLPLEIIGTST